VRAGGGEHQQRPAHDGKSIVDDMLAQENHVIAAMGIGDARHFAACSARWALPIAGS
jgi:hypothetical protein